MICIKKKKILKKTVRKGKGLSRKNHFSYQGFPVIPNHLFAYLNLFSQNFYSWGGHTWIKPVSPKGN